MCQTVPSSLLIFNIYAGSQSDVLLSFISGLEISHANRKYYEGCVIKSLICILLKYADNIRRLPK